MAKVVCAIIYIEQTRSYYAAFTLENKLAWQFLHSTTGSPYKQIWTYINAFLASAKVLDKF